MININEKYPELVLITAHQVGAGCSAPIFNLNPAVDSGEVQRALIESAEQAVIRKILEDLGADGLEGYHSRVCATDDARYDTRTLVVDAFAGGQRYAVALRYRCTPASMMESLRTGRELMSEVEWVWENSNPEGGHLAINYGQDGPCCRTVETTSPELLEGKVERVSFRKGETTIQFVRESGFSLARADFVKEFLLLPDLWELLTDLEVRAFGPIFEVLKGMESRVPILKLRRHLQVCKVCGESPLKSQCARQAELVRRVAEEGRLCQSTT